MLQGELQNARVTLTEELNGAGTLLLCAMSGIEKVRVSLLKCT